MKSFAFVTSLLFQAMFCYDIFAFYQTGKQQCENYLNRNQAKEKSALKYCRACVHVVLDITENSL